MFAELIPDVLTKCQTPNYKILRPAIIADVKVVGVHLQNVLNGAELSRLDVAVTDALS